MLTTSLTTYVSLQTFAIPGSISLSVLSGFLFPFPLALLLVSTVSHIPITPILMIQCSVYVLLVSFLVLIPSINFCTSFVPGICSSCALVQSLIVLFLSPFPINFIVTLLKAVGWGIRSQVIKHANLLSILKCLLHIISH